MRNQFELRNFLDRLSTQTRKSHKEITLGDLAALTLSSANSAKVQK